MTRQREASRKNMIAGAIGVAALMAMSAATAQPAPAAHEAQVPTPSSVTAARFVESCNASLERGVTEPGCQAPLFQNELERLKSEALTTQNPQLLSFVGDAYRNPRSGIGDIGQAYRWYLLAAVRGDPSALRRLSEMNRSGIGTPKDNVKALGYARLVERLSLPGSPAARNMVTMINELGNEMAVEEVALAESFADQLQTRLKREADGESAPASSTPNYGLPVPGMATQPRPQASTAATPGSVLPGVPARIAP